eukprot:ANDGO_05272.mRNA.1 6-hydroxy-D-nicotine oxidase
MWSPEFDGKRPAVIALCQSEIDVIAVIQYASSVQLPIRVRSGGHSALGWSTCDTPSCIVADISGISQIAPAVAQGVVIVGAGARMIDVQKTVIPLGFAVNAGSGQTIGWGGFATGGGLGLFNRLYGIASDSIVSARIVLANCSVIDATSSNSFSDIFWAIGGGSGGFGIVSQFTFLLHSIPSNGRISAARIQWDARRVQNLSDSASQYFSWLKTADLRIQPFLNFDNSGSSLTASLFFSGSATDLSLQIQALNVSVPGLLFVQDVHDAPYLEVYSNWADSDRYYMSLMTFMSGPDGIPSYLFPKIMYWASQSQSYCLGGSSAISCGIHTLAIGGVSAAKDPDFSAWPHRSSLIDVIISADSYHDSVFQRGQQWAQMAWEDITSSYAEWPRRIYVNSPVPEDMMPDWRHAYFGTHYDRLLQIKMKYDPNAVFRQPGTVQPDIRS